VVDAATKTMHVGQAPLADLEVAVRPRKVCRRTTPPYPYLASGSLVQPLPDTALDVPLYWQHAHVAVSLIDGLNRDVVVPRPARCGRCYWCEAGRTHFECPQSLGRSLGHSARRYAHGHTGS
jgi:hypothetical protein